MLIPQFVLLSAVYVGSFVLLPRSDKTKMSQKSILTPSHPQPQVPSIKAHGSAKLKRWLPTSFVTAGLDLSAVRSVNIGNQEPQRMNAADEM